MAAIPLKNRLGRTYRIEAIRLCKTVQNPFRSIESLWDGRFATDSSVVRMAGGHSPCAVSSADHDIVEPSLPGGLGEGEIFGGQDYWIKLDQTSSPEAQERYSSNHLTFRGLAGSDVGHCGCKRADMEQKEAGSNPPNVKLWELQSHRKGKCRIPNQTSAAIPWLQVIQAPSSAKLCTFAVQELVKNGAAMQKQPKDTRFC
jgi:hypothetical protein